MDLTRFIEAQSDPDNGYSSALREIQTTGKRGHWIWYIFPQLDGLGSSASARFFALSGPEEAAAYMDDPILGARLLEIGSAVAERLEAGTNLTALMNSRLDAQKLVSCMTLFKALAERGSDRSATLRHIARIATTILAAADAEGIPACRFTLARLA